MIQERPRSQPTPQRKTNSTDLEEVEHDAYAYRYLLFLLGENLSVMARKHRDILGDIEGPPRIKLSREEQLSMNQQIDRIYSKMADKIAREAINRNTATRLSYQNYLS